MGIILLTFYNIIIISIALLYLYIVWIIDINFIIGLFINLFCLVLMLVFKSYFLFYVNLLVVAFISYRYYHSKTTSVNSGELMSTFVFNIINICFSLYALFQMIYYYTAASTSQIFIPFTRVPLIKISPVAYMLMTYFVTIILILSINDYLSVNNKDSSQLVVVKIAATLTLIVLLIIVVNAAVYFIIHNFPIRQPKGIFTGNLLKDPINSFYRSAKPFSDCLWFSATTFFTVGYGDMYPVGNLMYLLSTLQMISAFVLGIIMIPILLCKLHSKSISSKGF